MSDSLTKCYIKELADYSDEDLRKALKCSQEEYEGLKGKLKELLKGLREQKRIEDIAYSDLSDIEVSSSGNAGRNSFSYVGVALLGNRVIWFYPKYMPIAKEDSDEHEAEITDELKVIFKVLRKYDKSKSFSLTMFTGVDENNPTEAGLLDIMLYLMEDYFEYGLYSHTERVIECNGPGEIVWDRTIDDDCPVIHDGKPYYIDLQTSRNVPRKDDYISRLHACVLTRKI